MARTMDAVVQQMLGAQQLQIAALQIQIEELSEQLAQMKQAPDKDKIAKAALHEVKP